MTLLSLDGLSWGNSSTGAGRGSSRRSLVVGESERTPQPSRALWHQVIGKAGELDASDPMLGDSLSLLRPGDTGR